MTEDLDSPLESHEGEVGPSNGNKAIQQKREEPSVITNNFGQGDLPLVENIKTCCDQSEIDEGIERVSLLHCSSAHTETEDVEPLHNGS